MPDDVRDMLFGPEPYASRCFETALDRGIADLRRELLAVQIALTQRHYAALVELQAVRDELTAVERRLAVVDAASPEMRVIGDLGAVTGGRR
jgi:hypothetical protein